MDKLSSKVNIAKSGIKMDKILEVIWIGFEFSRSISGKIPPISPKNKSANAWLMSISDEPYKGAIAIPEITTAVFTCWANDATILLC